MVASEAVPGFDVNKTHPYPKFKDLKGYKSLFKQSKEMIYQEARRRDPSVRMNANNRSNEDMVGDLATKLGHLLTLEDKEFIANKESEMRAILISQVATMSETATVRQVLSSSDRLRLVAAIGLERNLLLFKRSQDCSTREELDEGMSPKTKLHAGLAGGDFQQ